MIFFSSPILLMQARYISLDNIFYWLRLFLRVTNFSLLFCNCSIICYLVLLSDAFLIMIIYFRISVSYCSDYFLFLLNSIFRSKGMYLLPSKYRVDLDFFDIYSYMLFLGDFKYLLYHFFYFMLYILDDIYFDINK
jgi:hypothetical protein